MPVNAQRVGNVTRCEHTHSRRRMVRGVPDLRDLSCDDVPMSASLLELPALETAVVRVTRISRVEVGDKIRTTIDAERLAYPPQMVQFSTFSEWRAALAERAKTLDRSLTVSWRNYGSGDRRLSLIEWAQ